MGSYAVLFARTLVLGLLVAVPVGPMGILCIQRTMAHGWRGGAATGIGIASADAIYAGFAAFGLTTVSHWMVAYQAYIRSVGGLALLWLGWRAIVARPTRDVARAIDSRRLKSLYASAMGLTLTNPMTVIFFAAIFASAGLAAQARTGGALAVTLGVACGSLSWWLALATGVSAVRHAVSERMISVLNRISGGLIIAFGVFAVVSGVLRF